MQTKFLAGAALFVAPMMTQPAFAQTQKPSQAETTAPDTAKPDADFQLAPVGKRVSDFIWEVMLQGKVIRQRPLPGLAHAFVVCSGDAEVVGAALEAFGVEPAERAFRRGAGRLVIFAADEPAGGVHGRTLAPGVGHPWGGR